MVANYTVLLDANGLGVLQFAQLDSGTFDGCGINQAAITLLPKSNFGCADVGTQMITVTVPDVNGNSTTGTLLVTIQDALAPTLLLAADTVVLQSGFATATFANVNIGSTDNCALDSATLNGASSITFSCADTGLNKIGVTLYDVYGNMSQDSVTVFVLDTVAPALLTKNFTIIIDTATGAANISPWPLIASLTDDCGIDSSLVNVSKSHFTCIDIGQNVVVVQAFDYSGNYVQAIAVVTVIAEQIAPNIILGPMQVCSNVFNVKYSVKDFKENSEYVWNFNPSHAQIISTSFKGREVYVHWLGANTASTISVNELQVTGCGTSISDTIVTISGLAPDTSTIVFWSNISQSTLVSTDTVSSYFQWGYDEVVAGVLVSSTLVGETKHSYHNTAIGSNIANLNYRYWCETSFNEQCWNRSYFENKYPVNVAEWDLNQTSIWPNPFTDNFSISSSSKIIEVTITDVLGKVVHKTLVPNLYEVDILNTENLPAAGYFVTVKYSDGSITNHKLVRRK